MVRGFENLRITTITTSPSGIIVKATYPGWNSKFTFLVQSNGRIQGRECGSWYELSRTAANIIMAKVFREFKRKNIWLA